MSAMNGHGEVEKTGTKNIFVTPAPEATHYGIDITSIGEDSGLLAQPAPVLPASATSSERRVKEYR